ncbi:MAG: hypothetical protein HQL70_00955 [Magnetococcales bacterium]|nr:hypothetical protein [Magnetococcales bacterium]
MSESGKIAELESLCAAYRRTLFKVPHSRGDHSDRCRINNGGEAPPTSKTCICHVGPVCDMLEKGGNSSEIL